MATVYRARDHRLERDVALKVMHPHLRGAREARQRFAREARTVARLRHPGIIAIFDYSGEDSSDSYIATELLTGPTLKDYIDAAAPLPIEVAVAFTLAVAEALAAAHAQGVIHRDIKPENILLHERREVKLSDFGIAQLAGGQTLTATGQILGSPGHMAPEHLRGADCDARSDLFSLGTVLYHLCTGQLPFDGSNPHQILTRVIEGDYIDPLRLRPDIGSGLQRVIQQLLAPSPTERYASATALIADLQAFLQQSGVDDGAALLRAYLQDPAREGPRLRQQSIRHLL
ncbi:MAG: serine/threonine-protein kinase, partial [Polyangiales bacterium]